MINLQTKYKIPPKKTALLLEILVAFVILGIIIGIIAADFYFIKRSYRELSYRITALNLAREVIEFGEAGKLAHQFGLKYYYPPATTNTIPLSYGCGSTVEGIMTLSGYGVKEWRCFAMGNPDPFDYLGDIKEKKLVPPAAPDSVSIYYTSTPDPLFYDASTSTYVYKESVEISWKNELDGEQKKEALSVIPIRTVNNVLMLNVAEFWWENR